jgi:hypothetical protein
MPIGHGAHLGGALAGAVMYVLYLRAAYPTRRAPEPRPVPMHQILTPEEGREFERIRTKIENWGPQALTPKEQDFLNRVRARVLQIGGESIN